MTSSWPPIPGGARAAIERHRERVVARAARLEEIGEQLGAVLAEPQRCRAGWRCTSGAATRSPPPAPWCVPR
ncbi:hypothetical protein [Micromonospora sp. CPCC 206061]|uniref:hypothetical protein n=1 Tax=Micromonospora sp. CPCC 206061 TaxID=3122410 RepID=UPI002FEF831B